MFQIHNRRTHQCKDTVTVKYISPLSIRRNIKKQFSATDEAADAMFSSKIEVRFFNINSLFVLFSYRMFLYHFLRAVPLTRLTYALLKLHR